MTTNQKHKFSTVLLTAKKTATGIQVPDEIVEKLGAGKKPPVSVTINGYTYRSSIAVMGGVYMIGVSAENRERAKVKGGDKIDVSIELDTAERVVELPAEFQKALSANTVAAKIFDTLSNSKKKGLIAPIVAAKTEETRNRNIEKAIDNLCKLITSP